MQNRSSPRGVTATRRRFVHIRRIPCIPIRFVRRESNKLLPARLSITLYTHAYYSYLSFSTCDQYYRLVRVALRVCIGDIYPSRIRLVAATAAEQCVGEDDIVDRTYTRVRAYNYHRHHYYYLRAHKNTHCPCPISEHVLQSARSRSSRRRFVA